MIPTSVYKETVTTVTEKSVLRVKTNRSRVNVLRKCPREPNYKSHEVCVLSPREEKEY